MAAADINVRIAYVLRNNAELIEKDIKVVFVSHPYSIRHESQRDPSVFHEN